MKSGQYLSGLVCCHLTAEIMRNDNLRIFNLRHVARWFVADLICLRSATDIYQD